MAAFFSFAKHFSDTINRSKPEEDMDEEHNVPNYMWNLGASTSTSTAETIGHQSSSEATLMSKSAPPTPEGLRPRKSIERIRMELLGSNHEIHEPTNHEIHETKFSQQPLTSGEGYKKQAQSQHIIRGRSPILLSRTQNSSIRQSGLDIFPTSFQRFDGSPIHSMSSFYEQSAHDNANLKDEDFDIDSSMENSIFIQRPRTDSRPQEIFTSPDLKRGYKPKTAVGALLVAMADSSQEPLEKTGLPENQCKMGSRSEGYHSRILPSRTWMDRYVIEDAYPVHDRFDEDDTIRDDLNRVAGFNDTVDDDNQSSLHASPSSLKQCNFTTFYTDPQQQFQNETSFTKIILTEEPSSSRLEERSIVDHSPYDFKPITTDYFLDGQKKRSTAPRLLALENNIDRFNSSAINGLRNQKDTESTNTSLADTIEDEEEDYKEIPMYYQVLADDIPMHTKVSDGDLLYAKVQNHRNRNNKEDLLRSTFERLQDCLELLRDLHPYNLIDTSFFLGLGKTKAGIKLYGDLQALLLELEEGARCRHQWPAIQFFSSILRNAASLNAAEKFSNTHWVPSPGFRSSLGLKEEPQSPPTIRGGDTSLFSLPSDSANDNTPHTSNVSMATTITTIVSPQNNGSDMDRKQTQRSYFTSGDQDIDRASFQNIRKTFESLAQLLAKLEEACHDVNWNKIEARDSKVIESIEKIYIRFLNIPSSDLKIIVNSFEMKYSEPRIFMRTISNDEDITASRSPPTSRHSYTNDRSNIRDFSTYNMDMNNLPNGNDTGHVGKNQSVDCGLWSPTTNDMVSLISPHSEDEDVAISADGYAKMVDEEPVDDLRRTIGSFDNGNREDEREEPPASNEREPDHTNSFPATFRRRTVSNRSSKNRFW
eukprot:CAMPEP_0197181270 /NCGR_PEP_ID=MMETSP1423-20130617/5609_1 /TAXON_ID=476441 /ORGANISM="Pseudo-nitzschia heimii, Strain UNC1101" /LENGTH=875 /DNA_ID=CAMNT_0042631495 /DNA_START=16 /DNA_END=2640 /DNA_ORIENTATION=+